MTDEWISRRESSASSYLCESVCIRGFTFPHFSVKARCAVLAGVLA